MVRGLTGTVAPVEVWSSRAGLYWDKVDADAFAGVDTSRRGDEPVPLDWRHRGDVVLGCSRRFEVDDDGNLRGAFDLGSQPAAEHAGRLAQSDGGLGLSMSVRFAQRWFNVSRAEWDPHAGIVDCVVLNDARVERIGLTPAPTFPSARVDRVW
jgi:hypothetical protein